MRDKCPDVWAANNLASLGECEAKLGALPSAEGENFYADGNSCAPSLRPPPPSDQRTSLARPRHQPLELSHSKTRAVRARRQSCRKIHAVFAVDNAHHCAHLSFKPMADPKGKVKCQKSKQLPVSTLFSDNELAKFATFVTEVGFEPDQMGWRLSPCRTQADCPAAGDMEEHPVRNSTNYYTNDATCVFEAPTKRRLLFGAQPQAGVCVPT